MYTHVDFHKEAEQIYMAQAQQKQQQLQPQTKKD